MSPSSSTRESSPSDDIAVQGMKRTNGPAGSVMTVAFELDGQAFTAVNGGPVFTFNEAVSLQVNCETQDDIDYYWQKLSRGGDADAQQCGWLKDRYGLSWERLSRQHCPTC